MEDMEDMEDMEGVPADIYEAGPVTLQIFDDIPTSIWEKEETPKDFRDATIVLPFRNKGSTADCRLPWHVTSF